MYENKWENERQAACKRENVKKLPRANFSYGCSLCPFGLFLGFSFLSKVFLIQFFFCHTDLLSLPLLLLLLLFFCYSSFSSSSSFFHAHSTIMFAGYAPLNWLTQSDNTQRVCYQKSKHTFFVLFAGYTLPLFIYNFLFFIFSFSSLLHFLPSQSDPTTS